MRRICNTSLFTEADIEKLYRAAVINLTFEADKSENSAVEYELLMTAAVETTDSADYTDFVHFIALHGVGEDGAEMHGVNLRQIEAILNLRLKLR